MKLLEPPKKEDTCPGELEKSLAGLEMTLRAQETQMTLSEMRIEAESVELLSPVSLRPSIRGAVSPVGSDMYLLEGVLEGRGDLQDLAANKDKEQKV